MLPVHTPLAAAAAVAETHPLLPPALNSLFLPVTSAPFAPPAHDIRSSGSAPSAEVAKKKTAVDIGTRRPAPSAALLPPPPKVPSPIFTSFSDPSTLMVVFFMDKSLCFMDKSPVLNG
jgi:hypothetical protein